MRKIFIASIFIFTFCAFTLGQNSNCPKISIAEKSELVLGRNEIIFYANAADFNLGKIEYVWSTSEGAIIAGQGTDTITVRANPNAVEFTPTVEVEIKGLAEGCENTFYETATMICAQYPTKIDEFEISKMPIDVKSLDFFADELKDNLRDKGYIFIYHGRKFSQSEIKQKENFIVNYLIEKNVSSDRLIVIYDDNNQNDNRIVFWCVPEGAAPPTP